MDAELLDLADYIAAQFFLPGGERDDIRQVARLAAYEAQCKFRPGAGQFRLFAAMVIRRHCIEAVRAATRLKHQPLNNAVSLDRPIALDGEHETATLIEVLDPQRNDDPLDLCILREAIEEARQVSLSPLEREGLRVCSGGHPYYGNKRLDNAIGRVRHKLAFMVAA